MEGRKVCQRDCPNRTAECRLTCEAYKQYEREKFADYRSRAEKVRSEPERHGLTQNIQKNARTRFQRGLR